MKSSFSILNFFDFFFPFIQLILQSVGSMEYFYITITPKSISQPLSAEN